MIDWQANDITAPPLTKELTDAKIKSHISEKTTISFPALPCHIQAVERMITLVTAAAQKVVGEGNRNGYVNSSLSSRSKIPKFNTKKDYMC